MKSKMHAAVVEQFGKPLAPARVSTARASAKAR